MLGLVLFGGWVLLVIADNALAGSPLWGFVLLALLAIAATRRYDGMKPFVAGVLAFLVSLVVLLNLAGPLTCSDGWHSPSIGRQGSCSWHGGVDYTPRIFAFFVSMFVGILALVASRFVGEFIHKLASKKSQWRRRRPKSVASAERQKAD
jgi:hypothetical protein